MFLPTKLDRKDFPDSMPAETVDRILADQEKRDKMSWISITGMILVTGGVIALTVARAVLDWPLWVMGLTMAGFAAWGFLVKLSAARDIHLALVDQGFTCPRCQAAVATDTWSVKKQQIERDSLLRGQCPRCFEHVTPQIAARPE